MSPKQASHGLQNGWQQPQWLGQLTQWATRQPNQVVTATALLTLLSLAPPAWSLWRAYRSFTHIIDQEFRLSSLSNQITHLDEVLTMSAFMHAATGDSRWRKRYAQYEPKLEAAIQETIQLAPPNYQASTTEAANQALIAMESRSFELVKRGNRTSALALLSSQNYQRQKQLYAQGVASRNQQIQAQLQAKIAEYRQQLFWTGAVLVCCLLALCAAWLLVLRILQSYLQTQTLTQAALETANQQLEQQVQDRTQMLMQKTLDLQQALRKLQSQQIQLIQSEKMSSLGQLVGGMAHEINNPISFIHGNLYHVQEYTQDLLEIIALYQHDYPNPSAAVQAKIDSVDLQFLQTDLSRVLESMQIGTERVRQLILLLRNFSRLDETGIKRVNLHEGLENTLTLLQHRLRASGTRLEIPIVRQYGNCPEIACYPGQLNQVFMNVLANAIDAIEERLTESAAQPKGITIRTELVAEADFDLARSLAQWMQITIADQGTGIPSEILPQIFDPFFTTKPAGKGIGLGMSISYQIITQMHQGQIECSSVPGQGSQFVIRLPLQVAAQNELSTGLKLQTAGA